MVYQVVVMVLVVLVVVVGVVMEPLEKVVLDIIMVPTVLGQMVELVVQILVVEEEHLDPVEAVLLGEVVLLLSDILLDKYPKDCYNPK